jgi:hypothetical protein
MKGNMTQHFLTVKKIYHLSQEHEKKVSNYSLYIHGKVLQRPNSSNPTGVNN